MELKEIHIFSYLIYLSLGNLSLFFSVYTQSPVWVPWSSCCVPRTHCNLATGSVVGYRGIQWSITKKMRPSCKNQTGCQESSSGRLSSSSPCSHFWPKSQAPWKREPFLNICNVSTMLSVLSKQIIRITNGIVSIYNVPQSFPRDAIWSVR